MLILSVSKICFSVWNFYLFPLSFCLSLFLLFCLSLPFSLVISPSTSVSVSLIFSHPLVTPQIIRLTCAFKGSEKPTVDWYLNQQKIPSGSRYTVTDQTKLHSEINFSVLQIIYPQPSDFGSFYCEADEDSTTREWFELSNEGEHMAPASLYKNCIRWVA